MTTKIEIRQLQTIDELKEMQALEKSVWNMLPMPIHHTFTTLLNGGIILGAYDGKRMVGFLYSFAGFDGDSPYVCSHMLGIDEAYRQQGIGVKLKLQQAQIARELGYKKITWTFDPLESVNANLNLNKLGAKGMVYSPNHYGEMEDRLNEGLPSDRIHIWWDVTEEAQEEELPKFSKDKVLLGINDESPLITDMFSKGRVEEGDFWFVAIPNQFQQLKEENPSLALTWRLRSREVFQKLFAQGFIASRVLVNKVKRENYYVFTKK